MEQEKQERDVPYEGRQSEKDTQHELWVHLSEVSSLSDCPCFTARLKEAFNELEWPAIMLHLTHN